MNINAAAVKPLCLSPIDSIKRRREVEIVEEVMEEVIWMAIKPKYLGQG
jgi:hypothetical protein